MSWIEEIGDIIDVRVTPKASSNRIQAQKRDDGSWQIRVYVTTVPEDGKANKAVIKLLSKAFGVSKSSFEIIRGQQDRDKSIRIIR